MKLTVNGADMDRSAVAELMVGVAAAVARRVAAVSEDVYQVILREIPQLRDDKPCWPCSPRASTVTSTRACR